MNRFRPWTVSVLCLSLVLDPSFGGLSASTKAISVQTAFNEQSLLLPMIWWRFAQLGTPTLRLRHLAALGLFSAFGLSAYYSDFPGETKTAVPAKNIPKAEIKNILLFTGSAGQDPKLGETSINLWPALSGIRRTYPDAIVYVCSDFPDIFAAGQFGDKVRPFPISINDLSKSSWKSHSWSGFLRQEMVGFSTEAKEKRSEFVRTREIDAVFDISSVPGSFNHIVRTPSRPLPYRFEMVAPTAWASAIDNRLFRRSVTAARFYDRQGTSIEIAGIEKILAVIAPNDRFVTAGLWRFSIELSGMLGLDVSENNMEELRLTVPESIDAINLLKEWYYGDSVPGIPKPLFDFNRKIVVVNVYAVTQQYILTRNEWINLITLLVRSVKDAYFVFTHGGPMDESYYFIDDILAEVRRTLSGLNDNIIIPRVDLYPYLFSILGISDALITPDTGMSHVGSGLFGLPSLILTLQSILHWLVSRQNVYSILVDMLRGHPQDGDLPETIARYAANLAQQPPHPAAEVAKAAGASMLERRKLDEYLVDHPIQIPIAENDLRQFLREYLDSIGVDKALIPRIRFVDSRQQTRLDTPRFQAKLYTGPRSTYLLVDVSTLNEPGPGKESGTVRESIKNFEIIHEIMGHRLIRSLTPSSRQAIVKLPAGINETRFAEDLAEEEILAWLATLRTIQERLKRASIPQSAVERLETAGLFDIDLSNDRGVRKALDLIELHITTRDEYSEPSAARYKHILLSGPDVGVSIKAQAFRQYQQEIAPFFRGIPPPNHASPRRARTSA